VGAVPILWVPSCMCHQSRSCGLTALSHACRIFFTRRIVKWWYRRKQEAESASARFPLSAILRLDAAPWATPTTQTSS
jgi:hypothetical protein